MSIKDPLPMSFITRAVAREAQGFRSPFDEVQRERWEKSQYNTKRYHRNAGLCPRERKPVLWQ